MGTDTLLYIELPYEKIMSQDNLNKFDRLYLKRYWHEHINFFSIEGVKCLLNYVGLKIEGSTIIRQIKRGDGRLFDAIALLVAKKENELGNEKCR